MFNFGNNNPVSVLGLVNAISLHMESTHLRPVIKNNAKGEIHSQYLDSSRAKQILNWEPKYSLSTGLQQTIEWYIEYLSSSNV